MKKTDIILVIIALVLIIVSFAWVANYKVPIDTSSEIILVNDKTVTAPEGHMIATATPTPIMAAVQEPEPIQVLGAVLTGTIIEEEPDANTETEPKEEYQELPEQVQSEAETESVSELWESDFDKSLSSESDNERGSGEFLGVWTITAYCGCSQCCGSWSGSPTASGAWPSEGWTVACGSLPFGSIVYIEGLGTRCVEDRGVYGDWIDVYFDDHDAADSFGMQSLEVYLIE